MGIIAAIAGSSLLAVQSGMTAASSATNAPRQTTGSPALVSQASAWDSALRVARLTGRQQQVTDLVLQLDIFNKPATPYANAVYQVYARTASSDWKPIYTNQGARLLPTESGRTTLAPEVIPIENLVAGIKARLGQDVDLEDVELNCLAQIRYDLPGGQRDLRETFEFAQLYTALRPTATTDIAALFMTAATPTTTATPPTPTTPTSPPPPPPTSSPPTTNTSQSQTNFDRDRVTLSNGYRITLIEVVYDGIYSTWRYAVEELSAAQDLSNWVLGLPSCSRVVVATPNGEVVNPDPNARIRGIRWQTGSGFVEGEFSVTLVGDVVVGDSQVAAQGPDVVVGTISGPVCQ